MQELQHNVWGISSTNHIERRFWVRLDYIRESE